jgi:hypothetical protein
VDVYRHCGKSLLAITTTTPTNIITAAVRYARQHERKSLFNQKASLHWQHGVPERIALGQRRRDIQAEPRAFLLHVGHAHELEPLLFRNLGAEPATVRVVPPP